VASYHGCTRVMKTMKSLGIGIVGTGWVSGEYLKAAQGNPHCEVTGICSRTPGRAEAKRSERDSHLNSTPHPAVAALVFLEGPVLRRFSGL
jgi:hypothetical protein